MLALVYQGPGRKELVDRPRPTVVDATDAVVRITRTTLCGTDLHILRGDVPTCVPGTVLGHEGVGVVDSVGSGVTAFKPGDSVLISCITSCGRCPACRKAMYSHCSNGGWLLGHRIDGTQAEYVRVPHADNSLHAPSWTTTSLSARYSLKAAGADWLLRAGVDNVFDRRAWQETPYQYGHSYLYPLAPRTWRASLQVNL